MDIQDIESNSAKIGNADRVIEALIAVSDEPLSAGILVEVIKDLRHDKGRVSKTGLEAELLNSIMRLNTAYQSSGSPYRIEKVAGGYRLMTLPEYEIHIRKYLLPLRQQRLSRAALETLAVIAYRQPVSKSEIERIRGVSSDGVIRTLLDRNLIKIRGRADSPGRPLLYSTEDSFLEYFGLNDISELPNEKEIEMLLGRRESESHPRLVLKRSEESSEVSTAAGTAAADDDSSDPSDNLRSVQVSQVDSDHITVQEE
ncbi:MAG: SMC-Scp complex subunit ScpB [candidate division Zixibacteria bacterium CG_4_9_14_3_um_filter_46_8]|nr:MAG: SMC-Scp complex subunit ScpB [candidate division Zixibacteria bacterium CG_4_9_14_3_um_filter_46_8]